MINRPSGVCFSTRSVLDPKSEYFGFVYGLLDCFFLSGTFGRVPPKVNDVLSMVIKVTETFLDKCLLCSLPLSVVHSVTADC